MRRKEKQKQQQNKQNKTANKQTKTKNKNMQYIHSFLAKHHLSAFNFICSSCIFFEIIGDVSVYGSLSVEGSIWIVRGRRRGRGGRGGGDGGAKQVGGRGEPSKWGAGVGVGGWRKMVIRSNKSLIFINIQSIKMKIFL